MGMPGNQGGGHAVPGAASPQKFHSPPGGREGGREGEPLSGPGFSRREPGVLSSPVSIQQEAAMPGAGGRQPGAGAGATGAVRPPALPAGRVEGAGRSAPPARLTAESGISCFVIRSFYGFFFFFACRGISPLLLPPPHARRLPPTHPPPQDLRALETPRMELAPR